MTSAVATPLIYSHTVGHYAMAGRGFSNPVDLTFTSDGAIYVISRGNPAQAVVALRVSVVTMDEQDLGQFGGYGTKDGQFRWPTAIAADVQDRIYIADEHRNDIQVFAKDGTFLSKWGVAGQAPGQLNRPSGLAFDPQGNLVVVDHLNHRVQTFTPDGDLVACWGRYGRGPGQFDLPWGVTVAPDGAIFVADWNNHRIQKLAPDGTPLATFGSLGTGPGELQRPSGVAVDAQGWVYVADRGNDRVVVFTGDGVPIADLRGDSELSPWAVQFLEGNPDLVEIRKDADLTPEKRFWGPTAVAIAPGGEVCVLETLRHRIQVYRRT